MSHLSHNSFASGSIAYSLRFGAGTNPALRAPLCGDEPAPSGVVSDELEPVVAVPDIHQWHPSRYPLIVRFFLNSPFDPSPFLTPGLNTDGILMARADRVKWYGQHALERPGARPGAALHPDPSRP